MTADLSQPVPPASDWFVGLIDAAKIQQYVTEWLEALRLDAHPASQRVQMVQTTAQTLTAGTWATLTSMSKSAANGGVDAVDGMGSISSGVITMPTGSAGNWLATGQVSVQNTSGLTTARAGIVKNGSQIIAGGTNAAGSTSYQTAYVPAFEFTVADGDTIGLQGFVSGANGTTSTLGANGTLSFLRLVKLP